MDQVQPVGLAFEALANPYRRRLLLALLDANPRKDEELDPLDLLAEADNTDDLAVTRSELEHTHVPKLADLGFVEWNRESGGLSRGPNWEEIAPFLRLMQEYQEERFVD